MLTQVVPGTATLANSQAECALHGADESVRTVLLVDDDNAVRGFIAQVLKEMGFAVFPAGSAQQALALATSRGGAIDLAIVDIVMPGMSGLDLALELERAYSRIQILYLSGYTDCVAVECIARRSPELMLQKPFTGDVLVRRVLHLLAKPMQVGRSSAPAMLENRFPKTS